MKFTAVLRGAIAFAAGACLQTSSATAQDFPIPGRPVRIVVPFPAGGTTDIHARQVASKLTLALGVPVIVENRPGASTIVGALDVARAAPDGHTLLYTPTATVAGNPHPLSKLPYDVVHDFAPITYASRGATGSHASGGFHFLGPAKLPHHIVKRLNAELTRVLRMPGISDMYVRAGMEVAATTPEEQANILRTQSDRLDSAIRALGSRLD